MTRAQSSTRGRSRRRARAARAFALLCLPVVLLAAVAATSACTIPLSRPALEPALPQRVTPHYISLAVSERDLYEVFARLALRGWKFPSRQPQPWQILVAETIGWDGETSEPEPISLREFVDQKPRDFFVATPKLSPLKSYTVGGKNSADVLYECRFRITVQPVGHEFTVGVDDVAMTVWSGKELAIMQPDSGFLSMRSRESNVQPVGYESGIVADSLVRALR